MAAVSIKVEEPVFESQTKTKLGSQSMGPEGPTVAKAIGDFVKTHLDNYLHRNPETADTLKKIVDENERERKAMAGVTKKAREQAKKVNIHNKKLLDCRVHLTDARGSEEKKNQSSIFITEGDLRRRLDHQDPQRRDPGRFLTARQTEKHIRQNQENGL